jgi:hypothetical protein
MFFLFSCEQKNKTYKVGTIPHKQNELQTKDSSFEAFRSKLNYMQLPFSSKSLQIPLIKKRYPEVNVDTSKIVKYSDVRNFYQIAKEGNAYQYEKSEIYALGKIRLKPLDITAIVYLYQNSDSMYQNTDGERFDYIRPEPELELVTYNSEGAIIDRLLLHYFGCGDGISSKSFIFDNDTIKIIDLHESWNEAFEHSTISMSTNLYSINDYGKFYLMDKKQYIIDNLYSFDKEEIYESVFLNRNFTNTELPNAKINNQRDQAELFYHTWNPAVKTIKNNEKIFYITLPKSYGDYILVKPENDDNSYYNYFIRNQDIMPLD